MKLLSKTTLYWLLIGPILALAISYPGGMVYEYFTPGKVSAFGEIIRMYPLALFLSLLTPWGWLMYGGLLLMLSNKLQTGVICTLLGAISLGGFWPVWGTFLLK